jgi:hypothetical protein
MAARTYIPAADNLQYTVIEIIKNESSRQREETEKRREKEE